MNQEERTQRSRAQILDAALGLFSHQGFRATSVRDIAAKSGVSTGNVYHHFKDKETIFRELLDVYWRAIDSPDFPVNRALTRGSFPENLEDIGRASRESVALYRPYVTLIYVDVVEFEGMHIRKFYSEMAGRFERFVALHKEEMKIEGKLRPEIPPRPPSCWRSAPFCNILPLSWCSACPDHYGKTDEVVGEIAHPCATAC